MAYPSILPESSAFPRNSSDDKAMRIPIEDKLATEPPRYNDEVGVPSDACKKQPSGCGRPNAPGRPVFISHPDAVDRSRPDCYTMGIKGYGRPYKHPLFQTSNSVYGSLQAPPGLNAFKCYRKSQFTNQQKSGGNYQDIHFTTQVESGSIYKQMND